jgi:hypothetical protein
LKESSRHQSKKRKDGMEKLKADPMIDAMDKIYGPEKDKIKVSKNQKTMKQLHKQEAKKVLAKTGQTEDYHNFYKMKEKRRTEKMRELALVGTAGYDDLEDYQSSDYEFIDKDEKEYLDVYKNENFEKF